MTLKLLALDPRTAFSPGRRFFGRSGASKDEAGAIYIYAPIGMWGGIQAQDVANALDIQGKKKALNIYINSEGGDVFEAVAIYNLIARFDGKKTVYVDGLAASAASMIALAGDKTITASNAMWMIHNPWGIAIGESKDFREKADVMDKLKEQMVDTYAKKVGAKATKEQIRGWMDAETWMTAAEAKERGFSDETTEEEEQTTATADLIGSPILASYKHTPDRFRTRTARVAKDPRLAEAQAFAMRLKNPGASPPLPSRPGQP